LQTALDEAVEGPEYVGAFLYVSNPEFGTHSLASGLDEIETDTPMRPDDKFRAGSIMKPFIAVVTLQLVEEDRFSLDDTLPTVLPENIAAKFPDSDKITVRMLLSHRSGLPDFLTPDVYAEIIANPAKVWEDEEWCDISAAQEPDFAPGESWAYSNTNYILLGMIIEEATGQSWRVEVRERIFEPLNLENTLLPEPGDTSTPGNYAHGYIYGELVGMPGELLESPEVDPSMAGASGGHALITTTADLARFMDALRAGDLFQKDETLAEMMAFNDASDPMLMLVGYGLGIMKFAFPGGVEGFGHFGGTAGFMSAVIYLPAEDITLVISANVFPPNPDTYPLNPVLELLTS
jgi:D-alanyl-D-alanine carboxypeptidase